MFKNIPIVLTVFRRNCLKKDILACAFFLTLPVSLSAQTTFAPSQLAFGKQAEGVSSAPKTVTFKSTQSVALAISSIAVTGATSPGDFTSGGNCPRLPNTLGAGESCTVTVTFTPSALISEVAELTVADNAPTSPQSVPLSGTGVAPVTVTPATLAFGSQAQGTASATKTETLTNVQNVPLTIESIATSGDFSQAGGTCPVPPTTLTGGADCTILVLFQPTIVGAETGTLSVTSTAANGPVTTGLTGTGTTPDSLSTSSLSFGNVAVGNTSASKSVTLTNHEKIPLSFSSIVGSGDFEVATNSCGTSVPAASTCTVGVTYSPSTVGAGTGTLTFTDAASNSPQSVALSGTGTSSVTFSVTSLTFSARSLGTTSSAEKVALTNHLDSALVKK